MIFDTYSGSVWNSEVLTLTTTGLVGIGTTTPSEKLSINQAMDFQHSGGKRFTLGYDSGVGKGYIHGLGTSQGMRIGFDTAPDLLSLKPTDSGRVGIGTASPGVLFEVRNDAVSQTARMVYVAQNPSGGESSAETMWVRGETSAAALLIGNFGTGLGLNVTAGKVLFSLGRQPTGSRHVTGGNQNELFDAIKSAIPNTNDEIIVSGGMTGSGGHMKVSRAIRTSTTVVTFYGIKSDNNVLSITVTDGFSGQIDCSLAW